MMKEAIGLIETMGIIAAIEASDVMLKTSNVKLINKEIVKGGLVTVVITGDVGAVKTAVDSAVAAVTNLGTGLLLSSHVIPRPDRSIDCLLPKEKKEDETISDSLPKPIEEVGYQESDKEETIDSVEKSGDLSQETLRDFLKDEKDELVKEYLLNQTVAELREYAKQYTDFVIERKHLYRTPKVELVEAIMTFLRDKQ
ncbi:BMC domain-containing protein [Vagococcus proximus]|uniref:BMC domain-containing protein n=1 Tax=Vagococcus proximus TaxID=2991417 RepID=UPI0023B81575|nr:BMC domain-containing protein [Vagococcus proximus]